MCWWDVSEWLKALWECWNWFHAGSGAGILDFCKGVLWRERDVICAAEIDVAVWKGVPCYPWRTVTCGRGVELGIAERSTLGKWAEQSTVGQATGVGSAEVCWSVEVLRSGEGFVIAGESSDAIWSSIGESGILIFVPVCEPMDEELNTWEDDLQVHRDQWECNRVWEDCWLSWIKGLPTESRRRDTVCWTSSCMNRSPRIIMGSPPRRRK